MLNSVRIRLTVYYAAAFALLLIVTSVTMYAILKNENSKRTDADISQLADSFLTTVQAELKELSGPDSLTLSIGNAITEHAFRDYRFSVFGEDGKLIEASPLNFTTSRKNDLASDEILSSSAIQSLVTSLPRSTPSFARVNSEGQHFRAYARHFSTPQGEYVLVVLFSLRQPEEFLESIRHSFALIIPLGILLASVGGYFLARRALAPVVSMSNQASRIGTTNLHDRLIIANEGDEFGLLADSFNQLLNRLARSIDQQRRFMADASHELRTPVAILRGEADVALSQAERSPGEYRESLQILREEARRLSQIVENLFTLARADAGNYPLTKTRFYLDELLAECVRAARTLASAKGIHLSLQTEADLQIEADEALIRRMVLNLIDNAIKFTLPDGSVSVKARCEDGRYLVTVQDSGSGIPTELQSRVFERFFRADKARTHHNDGGTGAGLGLAISRWIAEAHDGALSLSSSDPKGSIFVASLPVAPKRMELRSSTVQSA